MSRTTAHPLVIGYLGRALTHELSAVQQYLTQGVLADAWGLPEAAARFRAEAHDELGHAERLIERLLALGAVPNAACLKPAGVGRRLADLLQQDARLEQEAVTLYAEALAFCRRIGDPGNGSLFAALLAEEQAHAGEIDSWLAALAVPGSRAGDRGPGRPGAYPIHTRPTEERP